jgi:tol-pal system protein YbgF
VRCKTIGILSLVTLLGSPAVTLAQQELDPYRAQTEVRMTRIENELRSLRGNYEEAMYRLTQLNQKLEGQIEDMQFQIDELEKKLAEARTRPAAPAQGPDGGPSPEDMGGDGTQGYEQGYEGDPGYDDGMAETGAPGGDRRVSDTLGGQLDNPGGTPPPPRGEPEETPLQYLEGDTPEAQFQYAFSLLRRDDLEGAEMAFRAFLELHPEHGLSPNANYWLGKTFYARGNYTEAARVLLDGYKQFADSDKGPDMILTLGLSLHEMGQDEQACATFDELGRRYSDVSPTIQQKAQAGQQAAGCQ